MTVNQLAEPLSLETETLFGVVKAAEYLGVHPQTIRYHVYTSKLLSGRLVGHVLLFTRGELEGLRLRLGTSRRALTPNGEDKHLIAAHMRAEGAALKDIMQRLGYKDTSGAARAVTYGQRKLARRRA